LPPFLALILCLAFVYVLLRFEHRQIPDVSPSLWIPTIWMLNVASRPLAAWFPSSGATPESSPMDRAFLIALILIALGTLIRRRVDWPISSNRTLGSCCSSLSWLVSILWSKIPGTSFNRWVSRSIGCLDGFYSFFRAISASGDGEHPQANDVHPHSFLADSYQIFSSVWG